jgi:uncharacterized damage-inducible protein DinB
LLEAYAVNERLNQYLLEKLDDAAWNAEPPGRQRAHHRRHGAHMHNVRHMWLAVAAKGKPLPDKLDRATVGRKEAMQALAKSAECCARLLPKRSTTPKARSKASARTWWGCSAI